MTCALAQASGRAWRVTSAAALVVAIVGCSQGNEDVRREAGSEAAAENLTPEKGVNVAGLWGGGRPAPLDLQVAHPNGVVLQLTSIQSKPTETVVGVRVINGSEHETALNKFNNRRGYLAAANGEKLYISPPTGNPDFNVPAGQTMEGELVFLGKLPKSDAVVLVLNENNSLNNEYTRTPRFQINIPLANAFTNDGSKKN